MAYQINNLTNNDTIITKQSGTFSVIEYQKDKSVSPSSAVVEYFMTAMGVRKKQVVASLNGNSIKTQAGAMQYTLGNIESITGVKGIGDFIGKSVKGSVTKESAVKPEYTGSGLVVLEPTYKHMILINVQDWPGGITLEDGLFLACDSTVEHKIVMRKKLSSAAFGKEGLFNLSLSGNGIAVLESNVPEEELVVIDLQDDVLKVDGNMAVCWSTSLDFSVERSSKSLLGSAINGEGLVNVYRGTGRVLLTPVSPSGENSTIKPMNAPTGGSTAGNFIGGIVGAMLRN